MTVDNFTQIAPRARMELVRFLEPFFQRLQQQRGLLVVFDGAGAVIPNASFVDVPFPYACRLTGWWLAADQPGAISIDILKAPFGHFPPTPGSSITAGYMPALASSDHSQGATRSWSHVSVQVGDVLRFTVVSATTVKQVSLTLGLRHYL
jgi:hypothetical protein